MSKIEEKKLMDEATQLLAEIATSGFATSQQCERAVTLVSKAMQNGSRVQLPQAA